MLFPALVPAPRNDCVCGLFRSDAARCAVRNVICPHCAATVPVPDERAPTRCPRCGRLLALPETYVTAVRLTTTSQSVEAGTQPEYCPATPAATPEPPRDCYASWEDFRATSPVVQRALLDLATRVLPDLRGMERARLPENLPDAADGLGRPLGSVTLSSDSDSGPGSTLDIRQIILGAGFLCVALPLIALFERNYLPRTALAVIAGVGVLLLGWYACVRRPAKAMRWRTNLFRPLQSVHLWVCEHGIVWQQGIEIAGCRWEDIEDFRMSVDIRQPRYTIVPRPEVTLALSLSDSAWVMPLAECIQIKIASTQLLPRLRRIVAGERVPFGAVVLDRQRFTGPDFAAQWSDIVRVMADPTSLFIDRRDQAEWRWIRYGDVSHALLVPLIAQILIEEAKRLPV